LPGNFHRVDFQQVIVTEPALKLNMVWKVSECNIYRVCDTCATLMYELLNETGIEKILA
jgi:hypothetical protein